MKKRNPYAKAVTRIRPKVIPNKKKRTKREKNKSFIAMMCAWWPQ